MKDKAMDRFNNMPAEVQRAIKDAARERDVDYLDLIHDHAHMEALQEARRAAIRKIHQHHQIPQIAAWFGVSRVAINNVVRPDRLVKNHLRPKIRTVAYDGQGEVMPPIRRKLDRKPKAKT